jgi:phosphomannomutase
MIAYLFDVDGVLVNTGCKIEPDFKEWFIDWSKDKDYYLITGGERVSTISQVGIEIVKNAKIGFHCIGNHIFIEDREYKINQFTLRSEELYWLENYAKESPYPIKTGNHVEQRTGSVNFSVVGRNANKEERDAYLQWDNTYNERKLLIKEFTKTFPRFNAFIGGNTSIDICLNGASKRMCIDFIGEYEKMYFFGDKCFPGGIDFPLAKILKHSYYQINNGYKEIQEKLKTL